MSSLQAWCYRVLFRCALCVAAAGCGGQSQFKVTYLSGWPRSGTKISVFGIKRDGLMSKAGWDALNPELSAPFGARSCPVAYSEELFASNSAFGEALESYVRANGVTDRLLRELAPAARGDLILLVTSSGRPRTGSEVETAAANAPQRRFGGGGRRAVARGARRDPPPSSESSADYQLSALFYSVRDHETVGVVELGYSGSSAEIAFSEFRARLESEFPGASCATWNWSVPIDPLKIRKLESE